MNRGAQVLSEFRYKCSGPLGFVTTGDRTNAGFPRSRQYASRVIVRGQGSSSDTLKVMGWDMLQMGRTLSCSIFSMAMQKVSTTLPLSPFWGLE